MQSVSFLEFQNIAPSTLHKKLTSEGVLVITMNNKPFAALGWRFLSYTAT